MTSHTSYVRECGNEIVIDTQHSIREQSESQHKRNDALEHEPHASQTQHFFPISSLKKILDHERVTFILNHKCSECESHLKGNEQLPSTSNVMQRILRSDAALSLFAFLIDLRYPRLILVFLSYVDGDLMLPRYFSTDMLRDVYFQNLPIRSRNSLIIDFGSEKWRFSAPRFDHNGFSSYPDGTILPYLDEERIGRGSHGTVYKVWIQRDYCSLKGAKSARKQDNCPGAKILVRKEIIGEDRIGWIKEWSNLERIRTLNDPHLIEIQKTYQLNDKLNILFPFAKANLFEYLRDPKWRAPRTTSVRTNSMWAQILGITNALSKIINFKNPENPDEQLFGSHLDLKPQNILVESSAEGSEDMFKITDFGQTIFIDRAFASSRSPATGGTDAYCPPELMQSERNSTYDVWSLGIIVLEVLAFAIHGIQGLTDETNGLDYIRVSNDGPHSHVRFYTQTPQGKYVLKKSIVRWMESLPNIQAQRGTGDIEFIKNMTRLCRSMLEPDMGERIRIEDVLSTMQEIFRVTVAGSQDVAASSFKRGDELVLVDLKSVDYYYTGTRGKRTVSFAMLENKDHVIRTFVKGSVHPAIDERQNLELLLPFQHSRDAIDDCFEIRFQSIRGGHASSLSDVKLVLRDWTVAQRIQMALTGHNISNRYYLESCRIFYYQNPLDALQLKAQIKARQVKQNVRGFFPQLGRSLDTVDNVKSIKQNHENLNVLWIELWEEKSQSVSDMMTLSTDSSNGAEPRRAKRQVNPGGQVPLGRVVVYCEDRILIVPFSRPSRLEKHDDMRDLRMRNITFELMDPKQSETFPVSFLTPVENDTDRIPGIPMLHKRLYEEEDRNTRDCVRLEIMFRSVDDAYDFYRLYRSQKARWLDLTKGVIPKNKSLMPLN